MGIEVVNSKTDLPSYLDGVVYNDKVLSTNELADYLVSSRRFSDADDVKELETKINSAFNNGFITERKKDDYLNIMSLVRKILLNNLKKAVEK